MKRFVFLYSGMGSKMTEMPSPEHMQLWGQYFAKLGSALVDGGAPFQADKLLGNASDSGVTGYSIIQAESLEQAVALTEGHPMLVIGGGIQIMECFDFSQ